MTMELPAGQMARTIELIPSNQGTALGCGKGVLPTGEEVTIYNLWGAPIEPNLPVVVRQLRGYWFIVTAPVD
jgi:hypothetical protein